MNGCETREARICSKCRIEKSVEDFHRSSTSKDGIQYTCKTCNKARLSTPENVERRKRYAWLACLKKFGITEDQYHGMFDRQLGLCAICHKPENDIKLAVDHCHDTGKVRGLLCKRCNMGIGLLGDNPDTLISAAMYLKGIK
jgi:Autographiviridae endonuclease VII